MASAALRARRTPSFVGAALVVLALACAGGSSAASLDLVAHERYGSQFFFTVDGLRGENPEIVLVPGENTTVSLHNDGAMEHNLRFGAPIDRYSPLVASGATVTFSFVVPANATGFGEYSCDPHRALGMHGNVRFALRAPSDPTAATSLSPATSGATPGSGPPSASTPDPSAAFLLAEASLVALALRTLRDDS